MVKSEKCGNHETFRTINQSYLISEADYDLCQIESYTSVEQMDLLVVAAAKLQNVCKQLNIPSICSRLLGWKWNVLALTTKTNNFRFFVNARVTNNVSELIDSVEVCPFSLSTSTKSWYMCKRCEKVDVTASELLLIPKVQLMKVDEKLSGLDSILIQHEYDYLHGKKLKSWAKQVETY